MTPNKHERYTGDVHLGRRFTNGVPLHRRGEREETMYLQLEHELMCVDRDIHIHIQPGDLFNEFSVGETIVLRTAAIYKRAARANPHVQYIVIRGNHDAVRDADKKSSFDVFQELMESEQNVHVFSEPTAKWINGRLYGFMPWHPFKSSTELAHEMLELSRKSQDKFSLVVTHCEIKSFGGTDENLLPLNVLKHCTSLVMNGHIHQPQVYEQEGVTVLVTGSMQPYAHGEDIEDKFYRTLTLGEAMALTPEEARGLNIRVLLKEGEVLPDIDCASLISKKMADWAEDREEGDIEVQLDSFDMNTLFASSLAERGVGPKVASEILAFFSEKKHG